MMRLISLSFPLMLYVGIVVQGVHSNDQSTADINCIDDYQELKNALLNNSGRLLLAFYPPNQSPSRVMNVYYNIEQPNASDDNVASYYIFEGRNVSIDYIFQWVDSFTLLLTEIRLFQALSFGIASLKINEVNVSIPPFCDEDEAVDLLFQATIWLKSYAKGTDETDRFYAQYFNGKRFIVLDSDIQDTTISLLVFEYIGSILFSALIYLLLLIHQDKEFIGWFLSEISIPCLGFLIAVIVSNIEEYSRSFRFSNSEWLKALPVPIMFPVFAVVNLIVSVFVVVMVASRDTRKVIEKDEYQKEVFPLPAVLQVFFSNNIPKYSEKKDRPFPWIIKTVLQVILLWSIASFVSVISFHYIWISLAFSAYPVRAIASLSFILPFILISSSVFAVIEVIGFFIEQDFDLRSHRFLNLIKNQLNVVGYKKQQVTGKQKVFYYLSILLIVFPVLFIIFGLLYFYSQALIDSNDSENSPLKTLLGAIIPTLLGGGGATFFGKKVIYYFVSGHWNKNNGGKGGKNMEGNEMTTRTVEGGKENENETRKEDGSDNDEDRVV